MGIFSAPQANFRIKTSMIQIIPLKKYYNIQQLLATSKISHKKYSTGKITLRVTAMILAKAASLYKIIQINQTIFLELSTESLQDNPISFLEVLDKFAKPFKLSIMLLSLLILEIVLFMHLKYINKFIFLYCALSSLFL